VIRDGSEQHLQDRPDLTELRRATTRVRVGTIGVLPDVYPSVASSWPASRPKRGLKGGDEILAIDGERMVFSSQVRRGDLEEAGDKPIEIPLRRDGVEQTIAVTPYRKATRRRSAVSTRRRVVVQADADRSDRHERAAQHRDGRHDPRTLKDLVTGEASPKQLMGPVGIAQLSGESAQAGWIALLGLMASISLNLGLLNLMPIPCSTAATSSSWPSRRSRAATSASGEGEDAVRRLRAVDDADGDGHLQRPDANRVDRKLDAVALGRTTQFATALVLIRSAKHFPRSCVLWFSSSSTTCPIHQDSVDSHRILKRLFERRLVGDGFRIEDHQVGPHALLDSRRDRPGRECSPVGTVILRIASSSGMTFSSRT
jgi:hypothetical protein